VPEDGTGLDSKFVFNEVSTYAWAQRLETQMDSWGREPGGD
jgi:hypothetical protein